MEVKMSDLIIRKALLEDMRNTITESSNTFDWINLINNQPTAYDVDKVVDKIRMKSENGITIRAIIEIVKGGLDE
ncbi:MAG: hypothetical protein K0S61_4341 [Anaerocolumna sp.]|nr:hypothetical protein [Anaerocolumna sp.]